MNDRARKPAGENQTHNHSQSSLNLENQVHFHFSYWVVTDSYIDLISTYLSVHFRMVSFRGQIKHKPRPDWSPLGV